MLLRILGALLRAILVLLALAIPSFFLPSLPAASADITLVIALIFGVLVFVEYGVKTPSFLEFRDAPPFNRFRYIGLVVILLALSHLASDLWVGTDMHTIFSGLSRYFDRIWNFSGSPVVAVDVSLGYLAEGTGIDLGAFAALALSLSIFVFILFLMATIGFYFQARDPSFNIWTNLPTFTPSRFENPSRRLFIIGLTCAILSLCMPFFIGYFFSAAAFAFSVDASGDRRLTLWFVTLWAWIPLILLMRGVAFMQLSRYFGRVPRSEIE